MEVRRYETAKDCMHLKKKLVIGDEKKGRVGYDCQLKDKGVWVRRTCIVCKKYCAKHPILALNFHCQTHISDFGGN